MSVLSTQLAASLRGDREAFGEIIQKYQNTVCAVTYSITGNLQQSEDLAQEAFVTAWLQLKELRDESKFPAWLCGIARNLAHNWVRKNAKQNSPIAQSELVEQLAASSENVADESDREAKSAMVWEILRELPETYREPLVLFYQQSQSVGNIAAALDLSEENVRQRLSRGRAKIRTEVAERIEQALSALQPDKMFYLVVLAALPVAVMSTSQAVAATLTLATGGTIVGSTSGGGTFGTAAGATTLWGIILNVAVFVFWILFYPCIIAFSMIANYAGLRDLPTLRSRRAMLKYHLMTIGMIFALMIFFYFLVFLVPLKLLPKSAISVFVSVFVILPMFAFFVGMYWQFKIRTVLEEDLGKRVAPSVPLEESAFSLRAVKRVMLFTTVAISIFIAVFVGFFGGVLVAFSFPVSPLAGIAAGFATVCVIAILIAMLVRFMQLLLVMASEEGMLRYPPKETYTVLKFKPQRWWKKPEQEEPIKPKDYLVQMIPGAAFAMILVAGCHGTTVSAEAVLLAILPPMLVGPITLWGFRTMKNARIKAGNIAGIFSVLWMILALTTWLYEPLIEKWGISMIRNYIVMTAMVLIGVVIGMIATWRRNKLLPPDESDKFEQ